MIHGARERRVTIATAAGSFIATVLVLGSATAGPSRATADDPHEGVGDEPVAIIEGFQPALPRGPQPVAQTISGVEVGARLVGSGSDASIEVALHNRSGAQRGLACDVVVERVLFGEAQPMARMMPEPQISTVHTVPVDASLGSDERRTTVARLPAAALGTGSLGTLRLSIRERS